MTKAKSKKPDVVTTAATHDEFKLARRAIDIIKLLKNTKGDFAGKPFNIQPWQEEILLKLFRMTPDGKRIVREAFIFLPRKNGKSEMIAAIAIFHLLFEGELGAEVILGASDKDQASIVYRAVEEMCRQEPNILKRVKLLPATKTITVPGTNKFLRAIPADEGGAHGLNPSLVVGDELHAWRGRGLYDALRTGQGARSAPLFIVITTAGFDRRSICYERYNYAKQVRDGIIKDESFLPIIYEAEKGDDWTKESTWKKANPALRGDTPFRSIDEMRRMCKEAQQIPAMQNAFRRLYLNQWCVVKGTLFRMCSGELRPAEHLCVGDLIESFNEETGRLERARVGAVTPMAPSPIYRIITKRGRLIKTNGAHPFWLRSGKSANPKYEWKRANELRVGSRIGVALGHTETPRGSARLHPDKARFFGIMAGDGTCNGTPRLTTTDPELAAFFKSFVEGIGDRFAPLPDGVHFDARNSRKSLKRTATRRLLQRHGMWGTTCNDKRAPHSVFTGGPKSWAAFLSGYLDTDGHVAVDHVVYVSNSRGLLEDCQNLLSYLGAQSSIKSSRPGQHRLSITDSESLSILADKLSPIVEYKRSALLRFAGIIHEKGKDRRAFDPVESVTIESPQETIGVTVDCFHTHITNGLITHNTEQDVRWISTAAWDACGDIPEAFEGRECFAALDLSATTDLTALVYLFPPSDANGHYDILARFYVPENGARTRSNRDKVPYEQWITDGFIVATHGDVIDYERIKLDIQEDSERFHIRQIAIDRWNATQLATQLTGVGFDVVAFGQGFASMAAPSNEFEKLVLSKRYRHGGNPVLAWNAANVAIEQDAAGNKKPSKKKSNERIDGIVALVMCTGLAIVAQVTSPSVYESEGLLLLGDDD